LQAYGVRTVARAAMEMYPDNAEMVFWPAATLASIGRVEESLPLFKKIFAMD
jgi:hypothetical protein